MKYSVVVSKEGNIKTILDFDNNFGFAKKRFHEIEKLYEKEFITVSLYEGATLLLRTSNE